MAHMTLLSVNNPKIKLLSQLKEKKFRDKEALFIAEGEHVVEEAVKRGAAIEFIVCSEVCFDVASRHGAALERSLENIYYLSDRDFEKISDTENPKGIIAVVYKPKHGISVLTEGKEPFFVVCDGIQDPGNLGTIIRSAAAAGCTAVAVSDNSVDPFNPKAVRSSGGCIFSIPVVAEVKVDDVLKLSKEKGIKVLASASSAKKSIYEADLKPPVAVIIGNEGAGISQEIQSLCDETVSIPMKRDVESINAAVSASVILFEAVRQRNA